MKILIPEELAGKMERELILPDQIEDIIREAEASGTKLYDERSKTFIAHSKFGSVTVWAVYSYNCEGSILVRNVYMHRMQIREDIADAAQGSMY